MSKQATSGSCWEALEPRLLLSGEPALDYHTLKFFLDPNLVAGMTTEELRNDLSQYAADLNLIFSKQTIQRFTFDPETGIILTDTEPETGVCSGSLPTSGFEMWVHVALEDGVPRKYAGVMSVDESGAGVAEGLHWEKVYDPSTLSADLVGTKQYWWQINVITHEFEHVFGAGFGEYYNLISVNDKTGVAPLADIQLRADDLFWRHHTDYFADPLLLDCYGEPLAGNPRTLEQLRQTIRFADVTAAEINGQYRGRLGETVPDLSAVQVKVIDARTLFPIDDAIVWGWDVIPVNPPAEAASPMMVVPASESGAFEFWWKAHDGDPFNSYDDFKCLKAFAPGYAPGVQFVSLYDAQEQKLFYGRDTLTVTIAMEPLTISGTRPTIWSLTSKSRSVTPQQDLELSADVVAGAGGMIAKVEFYYDADKDGQADPAEKIGEDVTAADGWTWTGPAAAYEVSIDGFMAIARDSGGRVSDIASIGVQVTNDPIIDGAPTLDSIPDRAIYDHGVRQKIILTGVSAGGSTEQRVQITVTCSNASIITVPTAQYVWPNNYGMLSFSPVPGADGIATITLAVRDTGLDGVLGNQDDGILQRTFRVAVMDETKHVQQGRPDLAVAAVDSSVWQSAQVGTLVEWTATVANNSYVHSGSWTLEWYLSPVRRLSTRKGVEPILIGRQTYTDDIFAENTISKTLTAPVPAVSAPGQWYVVARVVGVGDSKPRNDTRAGSDSDWFGSLPLSQPAGTMDTAVDLGTVAGVYQRPDQNLSQAQGVYYKFTTLGRGSKSNYVKIKFKNTQGDLALKLYDEYGIELSAADTRHNSERLSLSGLPAGVYYAQVYSAKGDISPDFDMIVKAPPRPRNAGFTAAFSAPRPSMPPLTIEGANASAPAFSARPRLAFGMMDSSLPDAFAGFLSENSLLYPTLIDALNTGDNRLL